MPWHRLGRGDRNSPVQRCWGDLKELGNGFPRTAGAGEREKLVGLPCGINSPSSSSRTLCCREALVSAGRDTLQVSSPIWEGCAGTFAPVLVDLGVYDSVWATRWDLCCSLMHEQGLVQGWRLWELLSSLQTASCESLSVSSAFARAVICGTSQLLG